MAKQVYIVIADSSDVVRRGLLAILRDSTWVFPVAFSEISDERGLRSIFDRRPPEILVVSPGFSDLPLAHIRKGFPATKCVMLQSSLADGASTHLYDEVISICDPAADICERLSRLAGESSLRRHKGSLSRREKEIIVCVVKGMANGTIAEKLHISPHTVNTHRRNISSKLDIHTTSGLTLYAIKNRLVRLDELAEG